MVETKPSYTDLACQVVRESPEPLPFAEIVRRVNELLPITTKNPKGTIRNVISQSRLIVNTGDGRYGWKYRLMSGSVLRLPLSESNLAQRQLIYSEELRDALWPAFFEIEKRAARAPVRLILLGGKPSELTLNFLSKATWGTQDSPELWEWLQAENAQPGDDLIFKVIDGEAHLVEVELQSHSQRDEPAILKRNQQLIEAALAYNRRHYFDAPIWDISSNLLATGAYRHPVPPDPLENILKDQLRAPELAIFQNAAELMLTEEPEVDPLVASLLEQIGASPRRRRSKREQAHTFTPEQIYQIKVTLKDFAPLIWRRIQVQGESSLPRLHAVLQIAMGWTNSHLHAFTANGRLYSELDPQDPWRMDVIDERQVTLSQIMPEVGAHCVYEYDFGDSWEHELVVEKIFSLQAEAQYPLCLEGERACPPDDVGGVGGYSQFLSVIGNRRHPDYAETMEWIGRKFKPELFDLKQANALLQMLQRHSEKRS